MDRPITDTELAWFIKQFPVQRGHVAVDVGCGNGVFSRQLHRLGYDVTGVDFADSALRVARRTPLPGVRYVLRDLNQSDPPGLPKRGIDLVVCRQILPFLTDSVTWIGRVRDLWLRPGGHMYAVIPIVGQNTTQPGGMTEQQIAPLGSGWAQAVRYDLPGSLACLALRAKAT